MTYHLFGNILTGYGTAANNRGENQGNTTTLQKIIWKNEEHSTVSAEAIRWALRYYWQTVGNGYVVNRQWNDDENNNKMQEDGKFDPELYVDDDVLGFMDAQAAKKENSDEPVPEEPKGKKPKKPKGTTNARRGVLEVTRAISTTPYFGDTFFGSTSGTKTKTSIHITEVHATRYQYGFALTPQRLKDQSRIIAVLDGVTSLGGVGGNHARFLYDFSPESIVLRWTHDFVPRLLYCFAEDEQGQISMPELMRRIEAGDIDSKELWIAGAIANSDAGEILEELGANVFTGIKAAVADLKQTIAIDLHLPQLELAQ